MDVVKISFKHKWLRKQFDKNIVELIHLFGRDVVFMAIRHYCHIKLDERDRLLKREADVRAKYENHAT